MPSPISTGPPIIQRPPLSDAREERKYSVSAARAPLLAAWLRARLRPDPSYPEGVITSCYFDTPQLDAYWDSADGQRLKSKLRLRWYGDPVDPYAGAWLEIKQRDGVESSKRRLRLDSELLQGLDFGAGLVLPTQQALAEFARQLDPALGASLEPAVLVRYQRIRLRDAASGLRVSLDTRVQAAAPIAGAGAPLWRPIVHGSVLELKSPSSLPRRLDGLGRFGLQRSAHSKYLLAVDQVLGGHRRVRAESA